MTWFSFWARDSVRASEKSPTLVMLNCDNSLPLETDECRLWKFMNNPASFSSLCLSYYSGEIVTAMYDNFVAYRSKLFRPESPLAPNKNLSNTVSLILCPNDLHCIILMITVLVTCNCDCKASKTEALDLCQKRQY